jgi:hypothetical protein
MTKILCDYFICNVSFVWKYKYYCLGDLVTFHVQVVQGNKRGKRDLYLDWMLIYPGRDNSVKENV